MDYRIEEGEMAPDFTLPRTDGKSVRLYDCKNKRAVLLFFFDHEDERCLTRLAAIGKDYQQFRDAGAIIFPISIMSEADSRKLKDQVGLPFPILFDSDHTVVDTYKVGQCASVPSHVCFEIITHVKDPQLIVIDPSGTIKHIHRLNQPGGNPDNQMLIKECRDAFR